MAGALPSERQSRRRGDLASTGMPSVVDKISKAAASWWADINGAASPPRVERRTDLADADDLGMQTPEREDVDDKEVTRGFLRKALTAQAESVATVFEDEINTIKRDVGKASAEADAARNLAEQMKIELYQLKEQVAKLTESTTAASAAAAASCANSQTLVSKFEERVTAAEAGVVSGKGSSDSVTGGSEVAQRTARMGSLGWDTAGALLLERAKTVLTAAGVAEECIVARDAAVGRNDKGSSVVLIFTTATELAIAKVKVGGAKQRFVEDGAYVWLDLQKSRAELRPGRMQRKMMVEMKAYLEKKSIRGVLEGRGRTLYCDSITIGYATVEGTWTWIASAYAWVEAEDAERLKALVEAVA